MAVRTPDFVERRIQQLSNLKRSTATWLLSIVVVAISAWRHFDTERHRDPLQQEVWIQWVSWVIIFATTSAFSGKAADTAEPTQRRSFWSSRKALWAAGACAVASNLLSSQTDLTWILPATTLATTLCIGSGSAQDKPETGDKEEQSAFLSDTTSDDEGTKEALRLPTIVTLNLICGAFLINRNDIMTNHLVTLSSILFLITRTTTIVAISRVSCRSHEEEGFNSARNATIQVVTQMSVPMLALLTIVLLAVQPDLSISSVAVLGHALIQAIWWCALISLIRLQLSNTVANLDTIGVSLQLAVSGIDVQTTSMALAAMLLSVTQSVVVLRPSVAARKVILGSTIIFTLGLYLLSDPRIADTTALIKHGAHGHPIEVLITQQRRHLSNLLAKQSTTVEEAVKEYVHRYGRRPPLGFDKWFKLAQNHAFVLPDEFDTFMASLEPFNGIHPSILKRRVEDVMKSDAKGRMSILEIKGEEHRIEGDAVETLTKKEWLEIVPYNLTVMLNFFDESMVSAPWEEVHRAVEDARDPTSQRFQKSVGTSHYSTPFVETGKQSGWAATRQACSVHSPSRQTSCPETTFTSPIQFIGNASYALDICQQCTLKSEHGLLITPGNMHLAYELVPIWSASKPSHFNDVLYPSPYYINVRKDYKESLDTPWNAKDAKFYWVGTATGGWVTEDNWTKMQRQRLVLDTNKEPSEPVQLLEERKVGSGVWTPRYTKMKEVSDLFVTRISNIVQCEKENCEIEEKAFANKDGELKSDPQEAAYSHKFVMDIDGNGFSGRYYRLLRSHSVVVKSTILQEWHDDRLIPWVHYVPLSVGYQELPEMARFLATTEQGLTLSERIAKESTEWSDRVLRDVDLQIVWLRMLLEYGRVLNPELTY